MKRTVTESQGGKHNARRNPQGQFADRQASRKTPAPDPDLGRSDRYPSDYGVRDAEEREKRETEAKVARNKSWSPGDQGRGREGHSKGCGGSEGEGTGPSGREKS